jgi:hypothetical protein
LIGASESRALLDRLKALPPLRNSIDDELLSWLSGCRGGPEYFLVECVELVRRALGTEKFPKNLMNGRIVIDNENTPHATLIVGTGRRMFGSGHIRHRPFSTRLEPPANLIRRKEGRHSRRFYLLLYRLDSLGRPVPVPPALGCLRAPW